MGIKSYQNEEFLQSPDARQIRILSEYLHPAAEFKKREIQNAVVMFGSARIKSKLESDKSINGKNISSTEKASREKHGELSHYYEDARILAKKITEWGLENKKKGHPGIYVCTGGGPGIMEAGNRGAKDAGGQSIALNISLPFEQEVNPYATPDITFEFHYFFMRKFWFLNLSRALIVFPGGFGTIDELFETLTLIQTGKNSEKLPVILYGSEFWNRLINFEMLVDYGLISESDSKLIYYTDTPDDAFRLLKEKIH